MMQVPTLDVDIEVPDEVTLDLDGDEVTVEGPRGRLSRTFTHPKLDIREGPEGLVIHVDKPRKKDGALAKTWRSHVLNMVDGVTRGYRARLKIVYSHFPIQARTEGGEFVIENFLGERHPRRAAVLGDVEVDVDGDTVTLVGSDKEDVGQTAANIESATRVQGWDNRVFQDGIYIVQKPEVIEDDES